MYMKKIKNIIMIFLVLITLSVLLVGCTSSSIEGTYKGTFEYDDGDWVEYTIVLGTFGDGHEVNIDGMGRDLGSVDPAGEAYVAWVDSYGDVNTTIGRWTYLTKEKTILICTQQFGDDSHSDFIGTFQVNNKTLEPYYEDEDYPFYVNIKAKKVSDEHEISVNVKNPLYEKY